MLKDLFKYFGTLIVVLAWNFDDGYRQCYVFDNIFLCQYNVSLETFVVLLISYICGIVSVELKLLQIVCNRTVVLKP